MRAFIITILLALFFSSCANHKAYIPLIPPPKGKTINHSNIALSKVSILGQVLDLRKKREKSAIVTGSLKTSLNNQFGPKIHWIDEGAETPVIEDGQKYIRLLLKNLESHKKGVNWLGQAKIEVQVLDKSQEGKEINRNHTLQGDSKLFPLPGANNEWKATDNAWQTVVPDLLKVLKMYLN